MASSREYLDYILEQLGDLEGVSYRGMMGEYILYLRGRIVGGIYDDRLLVKPTKSAVAYLPGARYEQPYPGAKEMLLVEAVDRPGFLPELLERMYEELPDPRAKKKSKPERITGRLQFDLGKLLRMPKIDICCVQKD